MRSADIFLSFDGRLDRERWLGAAALFVGIVVVTYGATWMLTRGEAIAPGSRDAIRIFVQTGLLVPWLALDWKRFQDLGLAGKWALICPSLNLIARMWDWPGIVARVGRAHEALGQGLAWLQLALAINLAYALACRRGVPGPNRYGPDPLGLPGDPVGALPAGRCA